MNTVKVKDLIIGEGIPKICVPIVENTESKIIEEAERLKGLPADIVEWRVDKFEDALCFEKVIEVLKKLSAVLDKTPILFTFRTEEEGGEKALDDKQYYALNLLAAESGSANLIDVEVYKNLYISKTLIEELQARGVKVIASYHDFNSTPSKDKIINRLRKMQHMGADILKIAVIPKCKSDVLELLEATLTMWEKYADRPIVTMSMSDMGVISRLSGEIFGSAITFGSGQKASAPGQIKVEDLHQLLQLLHKNIK